MFTVTEKDIRIVLDDYGIQVENLTFTELERYNYDEEDPQTKQVRVIVKADLSNDHALVLRFKNEDDAPQEIIEAQSRFAALLHEYGIETPKVYTSSDGHFAQCYTINGYNVVVTVENFEDGEIKVVDPKTAKETGELLAKMHNIAEEVDFHVQNKVLFDPLSENELFSFDAFVRHRDRLLTIDRNLYQEIVQKHTWLISQIKPLGNKLRYAVQGDISDCNLYRTRSGRLERLILIDAATIICSLMLLCKHSLMPV